MKHLASALTAAVLIGGCAHNVPGYEEATAKRHDAMAFSTPARFNAPHIRGDVADNWIASFRDRTLENLVKEGIRNNPDLAFAAAKVERAAALTALNGSDALPHIDIGGFYHDNNNAGADEIAFGGVSVSWEPDVWGRIANRTAASQADTYAAVADFEFARQSLAARIAQSWFDLNANAKIYEFNKKIVAIQKKGAYILEKREEIGKGTKRDVHIANALVAAAQDAAQSALDSKERAQRALEILIGRYPSAKLQPSTLYRRLPPVPAGLPAQLLERRPDLIAAQERVAAAFHKERSARLLKLPNVRLKLGAGPNTINDAITSLAAGVFAPLYTGGAIEAQIAKADAEQKAAIAAYAQTALNAFREVENALAAEKHLAKRFSYISTMVKEYKTAYDMTVEKYRIGESTLLDILIIQGKWIRAEIAKLQIAKARLNNRVRLYLALGGSFDTYGLKSKGD